MLIMMTYKKSTPQVHDLYKLQLIDLDTTQEYLRYFIETGCFQKKENRSNIKKIKCYNYDINRHYA